MTFLRLLILMVGILLCGTISGQEFRQMIEENNHSLADIQKAAEAHFDSVGTGRGTGYKQYKRWEYNAQRMQTETGMLVSEEAYVQEWYSWQAERLSTAKSRTALGDFWEEHGPKSWNATSGWNPGIGRITGADVNPEDPKHIVIGAQTGGVWHTFSGGEEWEPLLDDFSNMQIYSVAIHPIQPNIYFFGSGGGRFYKSTDFGATWTQLGSVGSSLVNRILIHPEHPDTLFAASQRSGLFRSVNGGESWTRAVDNEDSGYDFEFQPGNTQTVYASGRSIHVSRDGGFTFTTVENDEPKLENMRVLTPDSLIGEYISAENAFTEGYVPLPEEPEEFTAEVVLYRDEGDTTYLACTPPINAEGLQGKIAIMRRGTCRFEEKVIAAQDAGAFAVIVVNSEDGLLNMAGEAAGVFIPAVMVEQSIGEAIIQSVLRGDSVVVQFQKPVYVVFGDGPKMLGVSPDDPMRLYAVEAQNNVFGNFYRSDDAGVQFRALNQNGKNYFGYSTEGADDRGQAPRDMAIAVNPYDADEVHIAGINTWYSLNAGTTFLPSSDWVPGNAANKNIGYCHADVDDLFFVDSVMYSVTDGGIFKTNHPSLVNANYFTDLSAGLGIRQFYKIGISQTEPALVSGGSQDNGTSLLTADGSWIDWLGADGMETFIDKSDPNLIYGTSQFGTPYVTFNGAQSYIGIPKPLDGTGRWVTPFEADPQEENVIYIAYESVFRSENNGQSWTAISQEFPAKLDQLKIAPSNSDIMFAAHGSGLYKTETGSGEWDRITGFNGNINSIAIHPRDPNKVAIATTSAEKVYLSEDGGQSWRSLRSNLPNFSALALCWQNDDFDGLYLGMNYGIFFIDNTRDEWIAFDNNLPNVIINELEINEKEERLYAATYGRGLWSSPIVGATSSSEQADIVRSVAVFPNPARSHITLQMDQPHPAGSAVRLFNNQGRPVRYIENLRSSQIKLYLGQLPRGTYYLQVSNPYGQVVKKVVIQ